MEMYVSANQRHVGTIHFFKIISTLLCDNTVLLPWLGIRHKNHLGRVRKRSCFGIKYLVWSPKTHQEMLLLPKTGLLLSI